MQKLRIMRVSWAGLPEVGGIETHVFDSASDFAQRGHDVSVLVRTPTANASRSETIENGFKVVRTPILNLPPALQYESGQQPPRDSADEFYRLITDEVARFKPDVVHGHDVHRYDPELARALFRSLYGRAVLILTQHSTGGHPESLALPWSRVFFRSYQNRDLTLQQMTRLGAQLPPNEVQTGEVASRFNGRAPAMLEMTTPQADLRLFAPSRLDPSKGQIDLIEALAELVKQGLNPHLYMSETSAQSDDGEGWQYKAEICALAQKFDVARRVTFLNVPAALMPNALATADIALFPIRDLNEVLGRGLIEAMAMKTPVIATGCGGMLEVIRDGISGLVVPPARPLEIAKAVTELVQNSALRQTIIGGGLAVAESRSAERMNDRLEQCYDALSRGVEPPEWQYSCEVAS